MSQKMLALPRASRRPFRDLQRPNKRPRGLSGDGSVATAYGIRGASDYGLEAD